MMSGRRLSGVLLPLVLFMLAGGSPSLESATCAVPQSRQFDFWIGEWDVRDRFGRLVGVSHVERLPNDCALHETWTGTSGDRGHSVSAFDTDANAWRLTWVDDAGTILLSGGLLNGEMVMEGERTLPDGTTTLERVTWTPDADGRVRQAWLSSRERGMRWTALFEATYYRKR